MRAPPTASLVAAMALSAMALGAGLVPLERQPHGRHNPERLSKPKSKKKRKFKGSRQAKRSSRP